MAEDVGSVLLTFLNWMSEVSKHWLTSTRRVLSSTWRTSADDLTMQHATTDLAVFMSPADEKLYTKKYVSRREMPPSGSIDMALKTGQH